MRARCGCSALRWRRAVGLSTAACVLRACRSLLTPCANVVARLLCADVPDSLRSDRCCPLRQGRRPERPGPPALQRVGGHLLQGQRRRRLRRLGARPQPLGLLLQPLVNYSPRASSGAACDARPFPGWNCLPSQSEAATSKTDPRTQNLQKKQQLGLRWCAERGSIPQDPSKFQALSPRLDQSCGATETDLLCPRCRDDMFRNWSNGCLVLIAR